jgi:hypothetical protein
VRRKENALNDVRRKGEPRFTVESSLSTLIKRTMKAPSRERMKRTVTSLATLMEDLREIGPIERSPLRGNLVVKGEKKRSLTNQGDTEISLIMRSLGVATTKQR